MCVLRERGNGVGFSSASDQFLDFKCIYRSHNDLPIEPSERYHFTQTKTAVQLALEHVQREDAGHYTLFARSKNGGVSEKKVDLVIEDRSTGDDPPVFLRRLSDLSVKVGTRTRLLVEIRSSTNIKVILHPSDWCKSTNQSVDCYCAGDLVSQRSSNM